MEFCTNQWTGLYMIGTSVMKKLTTLNNKFYRIKRGEREQFFHVHAILISHVYIWFQIVRKATFVINIKFYDVIVTDMFHKYRIRSLKEFCKNSSYQFRNIYKKASECFIEKVLGYWIQDTGYSDTVVFMWIGQSF